MEAGMGVGGGAASTADAAARRATGRVPGAPARPAGLTALNASVGPGTLAGRPPASPNPLSASSPSAAGQTQHEVLQNFFQSLLSSKDRAGSAAGSPNRPGVPSKANGTIAEEGPG